MKDLKKAQDKLLVLNVNYLLEWCTLIYSFQNFINVIFTYS